MFTYASGDEITFRDHLGGKVRVTVLTHEDDVKNGRPGFTGQATDGTEFWGYDSQITHVRRADRYEAAFNDGEVTVIRSIHAGIDGPVLTRPAADLTAAAAVLFAEGYLVAGEWVTHRNYISAAITRLA